MPLCRHPELKFLHGAFEPVGELKASDVSLTITAEETVSGGQISEEFESIKDRSSDRRETKEAATLIMLHWMWGAFSPRGRAARRLATP
jgi:hypothetical protein